MRIRLRSIAVLFVLAAGFQLAACRDSGELKSPTQPDQTMKLRAEAELTPGCYAWPAGDLPYSDIVPYALPFGPGDRAIEFMLKDVAGVEHTLSGLLATRPVLIVFGAFT